MGRLVVEGKQRIEGCLQVQGAKNLVLPILCACLLVDGAVRIDNCPEISDVEETVRMLRMMGANVVREKTAITCDTGGARAEFLPDEMTKSNRMSILLMGAMLTRFGKGEIAYPGGCRIGKRPIDLHEEIFRRFGAELSAEDDRMVGVLAKGKGCGVHLPFPSVGATENAILCACLAEGETQITGAAREPEVEGLCDFLNACGAQIHGQGTSVIHICGVKQLHGTEYEISGDRIVAGTYLTAAAITGGECEIAGIFPGHLSGYLDALAQLGCGMHLRKHSIYLKAPERLQADMHWKTEPYPGLPTDLQPMLAAACTLAKGNARIEERIFEERFDAVRMMQRFGAAVEIVPPFIQIKGQKSLHGAEVVGRDLRGTAGLLVLALAAEGKSTIFGASVLKRGYENIVGDLRELGCGDITEQPE